MNKDVKRLTTTAMLCAVAYIVMLVGRIPISTVDYLKYDPKDIIITIGGFIYGPVSALLMSVVVSALEMVTVSSTGIIGFVMNVLQSSAFAVTAALVYKKNHTLKGAVRGLAAGCLFTAAVMLVWNYIFTPLYSGMPREAVSQMLLPVILPFNILKGGINVALTILFYKHIVTALRKAGLVPMSENSTAPDSGYSMHILILAILLFAVCIFAVLKNRGIL